ncbi:MAG: hypothetical protein Q8M35_06195, partial [Pseudohongiella sp.]|nr:hypothetical protein [Pseudohongiella sp.]
MSSPILTRLLLPVFSLPALSLPALALIVSLGFSGATQAQELPDPTRFEEAIQRFEQADRETAPPSNAIVLTGSSSIMYWNEDAPADLAPLTVIPRGFGGSVMHDLL